MTTHIMTRRAFGALCLNAAAVACVGPGGAKPRTQVRTLDIHVHLFGDGSGGSGCRISDGVRARPAYRVLKSALQIRDGETLDDAYVRFLVAQAQASGLDRLVLLGQDGAYREDGTPDDGVTSFLVPNDYVFRVCRAYPELMVPCPSINPDRRDALDELSRCVERGARVLKIHPPIQGVDVADEKHRPFFQACARHDVLVMVHTGHEHSAPIFGVELSNPARLEQALSMGCRVVACHAGTGWPTDEPDFLPEFVRMAKRHPNLWGDTSILGTMGRERDVLRLLEDADVCGRLVHGSDFPFPSTPSVFEPQIGHGRAMQLTADRNLLRRDLLLKEALGLGDSVRRAAALLFA